MNFEKRIGIQQEDTVMPLIRDIFKRPRQAWGFIKAVFKYYFWKQFRHTKTPWEVQVIKRRIHYLKKNDIAPYEVEFLEDILYESGIYKSIRFTGSKKNKFRFKAKREGKNYSNYR